MMPLMLDHHSLSGTLAGGLLGIALLTPAFAFAQGQLLTLEDFQSAKGPWATEQIATPEKSAESEETNALPQPHWSHLPIFGVEAAARGFTLPLPFGVGANYYREEQPFNITDLSVALRNSKLTSVKGFVEIDRVDTTQKTATSRIDAWIFPFLSVYGILGYMEGEMKGSVGLPEIPILPPLVVVPAQVLPLRIGYEGLVYGGGLTLAGGAKVTDWRTLTAFVVVDLNYTYTDLDFIDDKLKSDSGAEAVVFSPRLGLRAQLSKSIFASAWVGAMHQRVSETLEGRVPSQELEFVIEQQPSEPWNLLLGGRVELGSHWDLMVEGGLGTRNSILGGASFRF